MEFNKSFFLNDAVDVLGDGLHGTPNYNEKGEYYFINGNNLKGGQIILKEGTKRVDQETFQKYKKDLNDRTILVSINGTIGNVALYNNEKVILGKSACYFNVKRDINKNYIKYLLMDKRFQDYIKNYATGTTILNVSLKTMRNFEFYLPDLHTQNKVTSILENIDSLIENNKTIIDNLENISQTIFKQWFIDFEFPNEEGKPYKSSGGEMVESELGEIPKGWSVGEIGNLGTIIGGGTPSKKYDEYYTDNGISWITPKDLSNDKNTFIYKGAIDITELGLKKGSARILQKDTILFSSRAPIGYIAIAGKEVTTNQGFKSIVPDKGYSSYFIYHLLKFKLPVIEAAAGGSTFKEISGKGLKEIPVTLPTIELVNIYKEIVEPLFLQIQTHEKENKNLQQLRDTLLPKLLSGEIEIPDNLEV